MTRFILLVFSFSLFISSHAQTNYFDNIRQIYDEALTKGKSYDMLRDLTANIGPRLSGSTGEAAAVKWSEELMRSLYFDSVWLQPVMVPHWVRGQKEIARINKTKKSKAIDINVCALGGSVGTGPAGVAANVVEVKSIDELKEMGSSMIKGKIVFFNRPMDSKLVYTFAAYMGALDQRSNGPSEAAKFGAVACIVRSMSPTIEDFPHTGAVRYTEGVTKIPAVAVSTKHAEQLSNLLKENKDLQVFIETHCENLPEVQSYNVIGELKGTQYKDEIILVGGHLDSWDLAQGAHDDGTGCVQAVEVLRLFKAIGYKPKRTIRAVLWAAEENGFAGAIKYADLALKNKEKHIAALESDGGGFTPRGFTMTGDESSKARVRSWKPLLEPYDLHDFGRTGGGADIMQLAPQGVLQIGFYADTQRYFSLHHTKEDTFDKVNQRELELGGASMAAMVFLLDKEGVR